MPAETAPSIQLVILDPGHFHAALVQKEMYPSVSPRVAVYAPLGPELLDYLNRISLFNLRKEDPTSWQLDLHTGGNSMQRMLADRPGNVILLTGRNRPKIDRILGSLDAGMHVLADKPWIISSQDMPKLEEALDKADRTGRIAYDIMTERFEITSLLQRELVNDAAVFGKQELGDAARPGIAAKSIHHLMKQIAGVPIRRPTWFFDVAEYGEGLADVGTHVVDLVQWTAFPDQALDYRKDIQILEGRHWPTSITAAQFQQVTGEARGPLDYYCNNAVHYTLRGVHVKLDILWNWEASEGGDVYESQFHGSNATVELRQGKAEKFIPELYVVPARPAGRAAVLSAVTGKVAALQQRWPGVAAVEANGAIRIVIPDKYRVGHESHFGQVTNQFFEYLKSPKSLPAWERANMLAKYYTSTKGVEIGRSSK